jgi:hypothetical protein
MLRSAQRCVAGPGPTAIHTIRQVPALRCIVKNAAPRPGHENLVALYPRRFAFTAIDNSARWAITAASAGCLRISSAAVAS